MKMNESTVTDILPLTRLGIYNPQRLNDNEVELSFVARQLLFKYIFGYIIDEQSGSIPQHHLIIGQRGMGKSTLLKRMEVELRKSPHCERFIPILFPEEQYNIDRLSKFWLNCLDALADTFEVEHKTEEADTLDEQIKVLTQNRHEGSLSQDAFGLFLKLTTQLNRRAVLLIDNLSLIFDRLSRSEQHQLRAFLTENNAPILIGASAVSIEGTYNYAAPFYDAFQTHYLKKLTYDDTVEILTNLAHITGLPDMIEDFRTHSARLRTLHQLTGGNPRTVVMLFRLVTKGFSADVQGDLEALLDEITPLYKARFEELPDQAQVIIDAIALNWDPTSLEQLRQKTWLENPQLSPQLDRLLKVGWIEKITTTKKSGNYEIAERFFNVWYLMRRASRRLRKSLDCLSRYLEVYYGEELPTHHFAINLFRDKFNDIVEAKRIFELYKERKPEYGGSEHFDKIVAFHEILFAVYEDNWGIAQEKLKGSFYFRSEEARKQASAVIVKRGYGAKLLVFYEENRYDREYRPLYEAIKALTLGNKTHLRTVAAEVREVAAEIYDFMDDYNQN